jgi:hypothetical protein
MPKFGFIRSVGGFPAFCALTDQHYIVAGVLQQMRQPGIVPQEHVSQILVNHL